MLNTINKNFVLVKSTMYYCKLKIVNHVNCISILLLFLENIFLDIPDLTNIFETGENHLLLPLLAGKNLFKNRISKPQILTK
jgi:hypothetical protein